MNDSLPAAEDERPRLPRTLRGTLRARLPALAVQALQLCKAYGATQALAGVSLRIAAGSAHALLGENGAGKSTLVRLLAGLAQPDAGELRLFGQAVRLAGPVAAHALGVRTAFQEMIHVGDLSVLDNLLLPAGPVNPFGLLRRRAAREHIGEHLAALGLHDLPLDAEVRTLALAQRQKLEIARALLHQPRILLLDESTSTLSGRDVDWIGDIVRAQTARGATVVFISHRLPEVRAFCDTLTVLRGGRHVHSGPVTEASDADVIGLIAGRALVHAFPPRAPARAEAPAPASRRELLGATALAAGRSLHDASFSLHAGEIVGIAGLQGMGQLELLLACFGLAEVRAGQLRFGGRPVRLQGPAEAVAAGVSLLPEDRRSEGLLLPLSGARNAALPVLARWRRGPLIDAAAEQAAVAACFERLNIDRRALWTRAGAFSGGNQQKIALARWLLAQSRVLLLHDPTRGIDVGTKREIYQLMRDFTAAGGAVLFYSTELPELVHLADRALVFYGGRITAELPQQALSERALLQAMLGTPAGAEAAA